MYLRRTGCQRSSREQLIHSPMQFLAVDNEQTVRAVADSAESYALDFSSKALDRGLQRLLVRHAKRGALMRWRLRSE